MSDVTKDNPFYIENKKKLDKVGSGMCLAKWTQVTLQLQTEDIIIVVTTHEHTKFQKTKSKEIQVHYTILNIKNFVEEKC